MLLVLNYNYIFHTDTVDIPLKRKFIAKDDVFGTSSLFFFYSINLRLYLNMLILCNFKARLKGQK